MLSFANWLLRNIYDEKLYDEIEGDLVELYNTRLSSMSKRKASLLYLWDAILSVRNIGLKKKRAHQINGIDLLINNLKFSFRVLMKDKLFSTLNILGLALGISVAIIVLLVLQYDLSYDQHYANHKRIFRLGTHLQATNIDQSTAKSARVLPETLQDELPEIEVITRIKSLQGNTLVKTEFNGKEVALYETRILRADANYFRVFHSEFIFGDESTALTESNHVVITESTAKRYFANEDPIGKNYIIEGFSNQLWSVAGVIKDLPDNTHLKFDMIISGLMRQDINAMSDSIKSYKYWDTDVYLYILMPEGYNPQSFLDKWPSIYKTYYKSYGEQMGATYSPILQRLDDIHFHSDLGGDEPVGNITFSYVFASIGVLIILLACINYMNLSTAKSSIRATEIGMKKALGLGKRALSLSFLTESVVLSLLSLIVGIVLTAILINGTAFNDLLGRALSLDFLKDPSLLLLALLIAVGIGIFSGLYPSLFLPNIPTLAAIKGVYKNRKSSHVFRKTLITIQFSVSIFVIVCTLFMQEQIQYMSDIDMGFQKNNVVVIPVRGTVQSQISTIKTELLRNPNIQMATTASSVSGTKTFIEGAMFAERDHVMEQQRVNIMSVGEDYFKTMGIDFKEGANFSDGPAAQNTYICNEATVKLMGWGDHPIGKKVRDFGSKVDGEIIGVIKDFNYSSLRNSVEPLLIQKSNDEGGFLHLRISGTDTRETLKFIQEKYSAYDPEHQFEYFFLDQRFNEQYKSDTIQQKLISWLSYICIFISLLGLLGLSAFNATQRTKEIGIRKVLGATISKIVFLMSKEVFVLVGLSAIIVIPLSDFVIRQWLQDFAYRMPINYLIYIEVTLSMLAAVYLIILIQSFKTASANPVDSLKYE